MAGIIETLKELVMGKESALEQKDEQEATPAELTSKQDQLTQEEKEARDKRFKELERKLATKVELEHENLKKYGPHEDKER